MKKFRDTETGEIISEKHLKAFYNEHRGEVFYDSGARNFNEYLANCLSKNGTLEEITDNSNRYFNQNDKKIYTKNELKEVYEEQVENNPDFNFFTFDEFFEAGLEYGEIGRGIVDITERAENLKTNLKEFELAYHALMCSIQELDSVVDANDFIAEKYPFEKSFDELDVSTWVNESVDKLDEI